MKHVLFYSVLLVFLTACSESPQDAPQTSSNPLDSTSKIAPRSLTGDEQHVGPDPHAALRSEQHIAVAMQHANEGRTEEALDILARAIIANPVDASLIGALGGLLLSENRISEALEYLSEAIKLAPQSAVLLVNRSQAYRKFNRTEEAMADLNQAIRINPELTPARFNRGSLLYNEAKYSEALADFDICVQVDPETAGPYFNRAVTRDALGDLAGAIRDMNQFIKLSDNPEWNKVAEETLVQWKNRKS